MDLENIILSEISQMEKVKNHMISLICGKKLKATNEQTRQNKQNPQDTDNSIVIARRKGGWGKVAKGKEGQMCGGGRRLDFGW